MSSQYKFGGAKKKLDDVDIIPRLPKHPSLQETARMTWQQSAIIVQNPDKPQPDDDPDSAMQQLLNGISPAGEHKQSEGGSDFLLNQILAKSGQCSPSKKTKPSPAMRTRKRRVERSEQATAIRLAQRLKDDVATNSGVNPEELRVYEQEHNMRDPLAERAMRATARPSTQAGKSSFSSSIRGRVHEAHKRRQAMQRRIREEEQAQAIREADRRARKLVRKALRQATRHTAASRAGQSGRAPPAPLARPGVLSPGRGGVEDASETPAGRVFVPFQGVLAHSGRQYNSSSSDSSGYQDTDSESDSHLSFPSEPGSKAGAAPPRIVMPGRKWSIARSVQGASPRSVFSQSISERISMRQRREDRGRKVSLLHRQGSMGIADDEADSVHVGRARADSVFSIARGKFGAGNPKRGSQQKGRGRRGSQASLLSEIESPSARASGRPVHSFKSPQAPVWREKKSKAARWAEEFGAKTMTRKEEFELSRRAGGFAEAQESLDDRVGFGQDMADAHAQQLLAAGLPGGQAAEDRRNKRSKRGKLERSMSKKAKEDKPYIMALGKASRQPGAAPYSQPAVMKQYYEHMATLAASTNRQGGEIAGDGRQSVSRSHRQELGGVSPSSVFSIDRLHSAIGRRKRDQSGAQAEDHRVQRAVEAGTAEAVLYVLGALARQPHPVRARQFVEAVRTLCNNLQGATQRASSGVRQSQSGAKGDADDGKDPIEMLSPSQQEAISTSAALMLGVQPAQPAATGTGSGSGPRSAATSMRGGARRRSIGDQAPPPVFDKVRYESMLQLAAELALAVPGSVSTERSARKLFESDPTQFEECIRRVSVQAAYSLVSGVLAQLVSSLVPVRNEQEATIRSALHATAMQKISDAKDEAALAEVPKDVGEGNVHIEAGGRAVATAGMRDLGRGRELDGIFRPKFMAGADALAATGHQGSASGNGAGDTSANLADGKSISQAVGLAGGGGSIGRHVESISVASDVSEQSSKASTPARIVRQSSPSSGRAHGQSTLKIGGADLLQPKRKGEDHLVQSPFVSPEAKELLQAGSLRVAKRVQAKGNWRRVATQFKEQPQTALSMVQKVKDAADGNVGKGAEQSSADAASSGSGEGKEVEGDSVSTMPARGTGQQPNAPSDSADQHLHGYMRTSSAAAGTGGEEEGPWDPDLSKGHPYLVNQAYVLFRLKKDPQQFDQEWAAEAYQRQGGTADAITGYRGLLPGNATAIPAEVAERLGKKYAKQIKQSSEGESGAAAGAGPAAASASMGRTDARSAPAVASIGGAMSNSPSAGLVPLSPMRPMRQVHGTATAVNSPVTASPGIARTAAAAAATARTEGREQSVPAVRRPLLPPSQRPAPGKDPLGAIVGHKDRRQAAMPRFGWRFGRTSRTKGPAMGGLRWYDVRELLQARATVRRLGPLLEMYESGKRPATSEEITKLQPLKSETAGQAAKLQPTTPSTAGRESLRSSHSRATGQDSRPDQPEKMEQLATVDLPASEQTVLLRQTRAELQAAKDKVAELERRVAGLPEPASPVQNDDAEGDDEDSKGDRFMAATVMAVASAQSGDAPKSKGFAALLRDAMVNQRGANADETSPEATSADVDTAVGAIIAELGAKESDALAGSATTGAGTTSSQRERVWGAGGQDDHTPEGQPTDGTAPPTSSNESLWATAPAGADSPGQSRTPGSSTPGDAKFSVDAAAAHRRALKATTKDHRRRRSITAQTLQLEAEVGTPQLGSTQKNHSFAQAQVERSRYHGISGVSELRDIYHKQSAHPAPERQRPSTADMVKASDPGGLPGDFFDDGDDFIQNDDGESQDEEPPKRRGKSMQSSVEMPQTTLQRVLGEAREESAADGLDVGMPTIPPKAPPSRLGAFIAGTQPNETLNRTTSTLGMNDLIPAGSVGSGRSSAVSRVVEGKTRQAILHAADEESRRVAVLRAKTTGFSMLLEQGDSEGAQLPKQVTPMPRDSVQLSTGLSASRSALNRMPLDPIPIPMYEAPAQYEDGVGMQIILQHNSNEFKELQSPRHAYIAACAEAGVPPESILIRPDDEPALRLNGFGLGDPRMAALAKAVPDLPKLYEIHVADNRMSDTVAGLFLNAVGKRRTKDLFVFDFSQNPLGSIAGAALQDLLESSASALTLKQLSLKKCKMGDAAAASIFNAASNLRSLRVLEMDDNGIGVEAGLPIAEAISAGCSIRSLSLTWNGLGTRGVSLIANALEENLTPMQDLDLGFTNCGTPGAETMGRALLKNTTLVSLGLTSNGITAHGAVVLADGMAKNASLLRLDISENPIGRLGARALIQHTMVAPERRVALLRARRNEAQSIRKRRSSVSGKSKPDARKHGRAAGIQVPPEYETDEDEDVDDAKRVLGNVPVPKYITDQRSVTDLQKDRVFRDVRMRNCSFQDGQLGKGFDPSQPNGELELDLEVPFDRTIAERLLRLAEESQDVNFSKVLYTPPRVTGLRKGHFESDWEDKVAKERGMAVTSEVDTLQLMPAAARGGRRASLKAASMEAAIAKAAADAAMQAAAELAGTADDRDGRPPTSNTGRRADAAARRAIAANTSDGVPKESKKGAKGKMSEAKKREKEAIKRALGDVISSKPIKLCVLRVRRKLKRSVALWRALRSNMDDLVDITARHLADDPLAQAGRPHTPDARFPMEGTAPADGRAHTASAAVRGVDTSTNLGVHADDRGEILEACFAKKSSQMKAESEPSRPKTTDSPSGQRGRGKSPSKFGASAVQGNSSPGKKGTSSSRGYKQYNEDEEAMEGDSSADARKFQLPYAGTLRVRVRTAVVEPHKRRRAEEEAARVRMEKLLGGGQGGVGSGGGAGAAASGAGGDDDGDAIDDELAAVSSSASRLQTLIHVLNRPKSSLDRPITRGSQVGSRRSNRSAGAKTPGKDGRDSDEAQYDGNTGDAVERAQRRLSAIEDERIDVVRIALQDIWLSSQEAAALMATPVMMAASRESRVDVFTRFVQRIVDKGSVPELMQKSLELWERRMVQARVGLPAMRLLLGYSTGRWKLDLSEPDERTILQRLANENLEHRKWLRSRYPGLDTSQWGNQERFRNESLDGQPFKMTAGWLAKLPSSGILRFDFVGCVRPPARARPINSIRFAGMLRDARIFQLREAVEAAEAVTYDFDLETIYHQQLDAKAEKRWGVDSAFGSKSGSRSRGGGSSKKSSSSSSSSSPRWAGPPPGAIVIRRGDRVVNRSSMSGCPWPPRGARTIHDLKVAPTPSGAKLSVSQRSAAGLSQTAGGLLGRVAGSGPSDAQSLEDVAVIRSAGGVQIGLRAPGEIAHGSAGRKQVLTSMYRKIEKHLTGGVQVQDPVLKKLAIAADDGQLLPITPCPEDAIPEQLKARKPASVGGILPSAQASTFEPTRRAKQAGSTIVYTPAVWISDRVLQLRERRRMLGAKADMQAEADAAAGGKAASGAGSGAMSSGAKASSGRGKPGSKSEAFSAGEAFQQQMVQSRLDHRADAGPGSENWHELYVPHALDFQWTTESTMDPAELTLLKARQKGRKGDQGGTWRHDDVAYDGQPDPEGDEIQLFEAPPRFFSGCASAPNDIPLPPFEAYVDVRPRKRGDGKEKNDDALSLGGRRGRQPSTVSEYPDDDEESGLVEAGSTEESREIPRMAYESFPGIFMPQRLEIRPMHPAAARALRIQAGLVLVDLLGLLVRSYLSSRQLSDLVRLLPLSMTALRIEVVVALFPKVVDLPQFYRVMFALSVQERREIIHRLGLLNLLDPFNIDGDVELNFKYWDERQVGGMLAKLSVVETSKSFRGLGGRGTPDFNAIQGWKLPSSWLDEMPKEGVLKVHYSSTAQGAAYDEEARRNLCRLVLTYC